MKSSGWYVRRLQGAVLLLLGVAASATAFAVAERQRRAEEREEFAAMGDVHALALQSRLSGAIEILHYIPALHESSKEFSRGEFARFVRAALARDDVVRVVQWAPRVPEDARARFEAAAHADGRASFRFSDHAGPGVLATAGERDEYLPVLYSEPEDRALGLDLLSVAELSEPAARARDGGRVTCSVPFHPPGVPGDALELAVFMPVYERGLPRDTVAQRRAALDGLAVVSLSAEPLVELVLGDALEDPAFGVALIDPAAPAYDRVLYESDLGLGLAPEDDAALAHAHALELADRHLQVVLTRRSFRAKRPWGVLALGLALTCLALLAARVASIVTGLRRSVEEARKLGQYTLHKRLGEGGMGVVYRARHAMLRRPTAIKLLRPELRGQAIARRFEREVQLTSRLTHPNVVAIYDYGKTPDGLFYYAMEYIDGISLAELVRRGGAQPPARVVFIIRQIASALVEAHERGLLHRDISPANVMLTRRGGMHDFVKVLDFGLVKDLEDRVSEATDPRKLLGTPKYLAPERITSAASGGAAGHEEDGRVDLYALGAVAYYLLVGDHVFSGTSITELCQQHVREPVRPPSWRVDGEIPAALERLVLR
ncbi:MAG: CHASE domain-containing protein, partial [Myxococcales bacterium]|nr:CHASE domain-containing protein [Myxococcales bacterium]